MTLVKDPVARARKASTPRKAAVLRDQLESELALNDELPAGWEPKAEEALRILRAEHGDALDRLEYGEADPDFRQVTLSPGAKRGQSEADDPEPVTRSSQRDGKGGRPAGARTPARRAAASSPRRRAGGRGRGRSSLARSTGIPAAATDTARTVMGLVGTALGLVFLYLLLSRPQALEVASAGFAGAVRGLVSPVDPLRPRAAAQRERPAPRAPRASPRSTVQPSPIRTTGATP